LLPGHGTTGIESQQTVANPQPRPASARFVNEMKPVTQFPMRIPGRIEVNAAARVRTAPDQWLP